MLTGDTNIVVALTVLLWADGVRRLATARGEATDVLLLRRPFAGAWRAIVPRRWNGFFVASWWSPCLSAVAFEVDADDASAAHERPLSPGRYQARARRRLRRAAAPVAVLRALGLVLLLTIALGLPLSARTYGIAGLIRVATFAAELIAAIIVVTALALRRLGLRWGSIARQILPLLSPFAAPRACEIVWRAALEPDGTATRALLATRAVMGDARFAQWARPLAYDVLSDRVPAMQDTRSPDDRLAMRLAHVFAEVFDSHYAMRIVSEDPAGDVNVGEAEAFCPRCGALYGVTTRSCADCEGVSLVSSQAALAAGAP